MLNEVEAPPSRELRQLTGARGVAAWAVVLYHLRLSIAGLPAPVVAVLAKGYLAVDFFFLLSGFVIWLAWHGRLSLPSREREGLGEGMSARCPCETSPPLAPPASGRVIVWFWQKRVARIWPLHAAMLGLAIALATVQAARGHPDPAFPWAELPLHLLLVQAWGTTGGLHWNDPAWSISAELAAYLLFPLLIRAADWRRWSTPALVGVAASALLVLPAVMGLGGLGRDIPRFGLLRCLGEFTAGTVLAALYLRGGGIRAPLILGLTLLFAAMVGIPETLVVPPAFAALLLALARGRAAPLASRPVHWLGAISYATYLSHFLLWKAVKLFLPAGPQPAAIIVAYLLLVLIASHVLYRWLELPAQRWINGLDIRNDTAASALPTDGRENRLFR